MASHEDRQYRSRVEILRDFLGAVRETGKKTRVIGLANLNPASYQSYLDFSLAHRLVQSTSAGYRLTPRADSVLDSIDRLVARSAELDAALLDLRRYLSSSKLPTARSKRALRYVSPVALNEMVRLNAESLGTAEEPATIPHSDGIPNGGRSNGSSRTPRATATLHIPDGWPHAGEILTPRPRRPHPPSQR